ncbi:MAG: hypothetical protein AAF570_13395, partial [Bacteroidota bacterium]
QESQDDDWNFDGVHFIHTRIGEELKKQADTVFRLLDSTFGNNPYKPRLESTERMYNELMREKRPDDYIPVLQTMQNHTPGSLDDLLKAKFTYEQNSHKNRNTCLVASAKTGHDMESARIGWDFALRQYEEESQNAVAILKEAVYTARKESREVYHEDAGLESKIEYHLDYFTEASSVAAAMTTYISNMDKANTALATAFANLTTAYIKGWNQTASADITLIQDNRKDSKTLWTSIQDYYKKQFGIKRTS